MAPSQALSWLGRLLDCVVDRLAGARVVRIEPVYLSGPCTRYFARYSWGLTLLNGSVPKANPKIWDVRAVRAGNTALI